MPEEKHGWSDEERWTRRYLVLLVLALARAVLESGFLKAELKGEFFFSKLWFYSLLFFSDVSIARAMGVFRDFLFFPFVIYVLFIFMDRYLLFDEFAEGFGISYLLRSILSFFFFSTDIPKASVVSYFFFRALLSLYLIISLRRRFYRVLISFLASYFLWQMLHLGLFYGKFYPLFLLFGIGGEVLFLVSGYLYFVVFSIVSCGAWILRFIRSRFEDLSLVYVLLVSSLGYFLATYDVVHIRLIVPFTTVLGFVLVNIVIREVFGKSIGVGFRPNLPDIILVLLAISIFGSSRGLIVISLPTVVLLMTFYHLRPLALGERVFGVFLRSFFAFFLVMVAYLSLSDFFITSEAFVVAIGCAIYALFDGMVRMVRGSLSKFFAFLAAVSPAFVIHQPEDIAVAVVLGVVSYILERSKVPRVLSAFYFVAKFCYLKYVRLRPF